MPDVPVASAVKRAGTAAPARGEEPDRRAEIGEGFLRPLLGLRPDRRVVQRLAMERRDGGEQEADQPRHRDRRRPTERRGQAQHQRRRHHPSGIAREDVDAEGAALALRAHLGRHDRVIGRVEDGNPDAGDQGDRHQPPVAREQGDQRQRRGLQDQPGEQHRPRADPVDQDAGRELGDAGGDRQHREEQAEIGPAHREIPLDQGKQRRQHQHVEMAEPVADGDQPHRFQLAPREREDAGHVCALPPPRA